MTTYKIVRKYLKSENRPERQDRVIMRGLTLKEAQAHCGSPETSSRTCTSKKGIDHTSKYGQWFDCYTEEK